MSIQRRTQLGFVDNKPSDDPITLVDLSDALTAMILGRHGTEGNVYTLDIVGPTFEPVADRWQFAVSAPNRAVQVRTARGHRLAFGLDERGVPAVFARQTGSSRTDLVVSDVVVHGDGPPALPRSRIFIPPPPTEASPTEAGGSPGGDGGGGDDDDGGGGDDGDGGGGGGPR